MNLWTRAPRRMDTKIYFTHVAFFLFVMLKVSRALDPTPAAQRHTMRSSTDLTAMSPTLNGRRVESRVTRDATNKSSSTSSNVHTTPSVVKRDANEGTPNPIAMSTPAPASAVTPTTSKIVTTTEKTHRTVAWDPKWEEDFIYDYKSLRNAGLSISAVLFIVGIMILGCGRPCPLSRCHQRSPKSH